MAPLLSGSGQVGVAEELPGGSCELYVAKRHPGAALASMIVLMRLLVVAAAALSSASGASLILKDADVPLQVGAPLQLDCGFQGHPRHCFWETEDGRVFQMEDVHPGLHAGIRAPYNLTQNQCGIVVEQSSAEDAGVWTCRVLLEGEALRGSVRVGQACNSPFVSVGTGCYYFSDQLTMNWHDARSVCHTLSVTADLAVLDDCHEFQLVWNHILLNYGEYWHWIGGTDENQEGTFHWVDGTYMAQGMPFWRVGQPDGDGNCVPMCVTDGYFCDWPCESVGHFVCQELQ